MAAHTDKETRAKEFLKNSIADISHQLKTPLAALNIYNGLLQGEAAGLPNIKEFADLSEQELDRIETLVRNLLKITKLDAGTLVTQKAPENVGDMMGEIEQHFSYRARQEQKTLQFSGPETTMLFCDREWFMEAVSNLVKNALDHTKSGDTVSISWRELPSQVRITVTDTGSGIHPEDIYHIFKRFYRSRFSKDTQGVGLGLGLRLGDGDVAVGLGLGDGGVLLDEAGVVRAQVLDEPILIGDVLDIAGEDLNAQLVHVLAGLLHHLVGKGVPVRINLLEGQGADDFTHIALEGVLQFISNIIGLFVQKVFCCLLQRLYIRGNPNLGNRIHIDVDKVIGWHGLLGLDVHRNLSQVEHVQPLQEGDAEPGSPNQDLRLLVQARNDVRLVGRGFDIAGQQQQHKDNDTDSHGDYICRELDEI